MAGKKGGDNSKKAVGQARKAQTAANKAAADNAKKAAAEDADWERGAKNNSKKEAQAAKKAEQAKKKADKEAAIAEEEKSLPNRAGPKNSKTAVKKTNRGIGNALAEIDGNQNQKLGAIAAKTIEEALDALVIDSKSAIQIDRHPERRVRAAYAAFEERRLQEMDEDGSGQGLRLIQKQKQIKREFDNSPENPMKKASVVSHNAKQDEIEENRQRQKALTEARLTTN
ncbi:DUF1014-domain-containing protein [Annulohypoxylon moriforme]|nr:DUF1014-domain-containing protein [Annulohypoxylon moriforme]